MRRLELKHHLYGDYSELKSYANMDADGEPNWRFRPHSFVHYNYCSKSDAHSIYKSKEKALISLEISAF